jgi:WD40 repeat protein
MQRNNARARGRLVAGGAVLIVAAGLAGCGAVFSSAPQKVKVNAPQLHGLTATLTDKGLDRGGVSQVQFSQDGRTLAAVDYNGQLYLWSTVTRKQTGLVPFFQATAGLDHPLPGLPADLKVLAVGTGNDPAAKTYLLDTATGAETATLTDPSGPFPPITERPVPGVPGPPPPGPPQGLFSLAFSPDGHMLAVGDSGRFVHFYDVDSLGRQASLSATVALPQQPMSMAFSPDGKTLAVGGDASAAYLLSTTTHRVTAALAVPNNDADAYSVEFSPDGRTLAVGDYDQTILMDIAADTVAATLAEPPASPAGDQTTFPVFSPDGRTLATYDGSGQAYLWDIATRHIVATVADPATQGVNTVTFSPDGRTLAAGDGNGRTYLWTVPKGA